MNAKDCVKDFINVWDSYFVKNNIKESQFTTRLFFKPKEWKGEKTGITFFENELPKEDEVLYIELLLNEGDNFIPFGMKDGKRYLYKLEYRPISEYDVFERTSKSNVSYTVIGIEHSQLTLCTEKFIKNIEEEEIDKNALEEIQLSRLVDVPFSSMTLRDFYCILHNVPMTGHKWLNDLIKENGRNKNSPTNGHCSCKD